MGSDLVEFTNSISFSFFVVVGEEKRDEDDDNDEKTENQIQAFEYQQFPKIVDAKMRFISRYQINLIILTLPAHFDLLIFVDFGKNRVKLADQNGPEG